MLFGLKASTERYLETVSKQRELASSSTGTDFCVQDAIGGFACGCNICMQKRNEFGQIMGEIFEWPKEKSEPFWKQVREIGEKLPQYSEGQIIKYLFDEQRTPHPTSPLQDSEEKI